MGIKVSFQKQALYQHPCVSALQSALYFPVHDRAILRELAKKIAEIAETDAMKQKKKRWTENHDLKSTYPVIFVDPEDGWHEILPPNVYQCTDPLARAWENVLRRDLYSAEMIQDDRVITKYFHVPWYYTETDFGIPAKMEYNADDTGIYHMTSIIEDYETDFPKLRFPQLMIDRQKSQQVMECAQQTFDGILDCQFSMKWHWADDFLHVFAALRGMENFMSDFYTAPEWIDKMMQFMVDGVIQRFSFLETQGLLSLNNDSTYLGTGGQGYTSQLPAQDFSNIVRTKDLWLTLQAQETASCNPAMFGSLILPHFIRLAEHFGLVHYGCCEPYHVRWKYIKKIPRLRHVSVSPWSDYATVPEYLGKNYVASIKVSSTPLAMPNMDETVIRSECRRIINETYGGICEFIMKGNHTIGNHPHNLIRWTQIMREEMVRKYEL